jgi:hypothetical protein
VHTLGARLGKRGDDLGHGIDLGADVEIRTLMRGRPKR